MRVQLLIWCAVLAFAGCSTDKNEDEQDWHVDPTQQRLDDQQPILSPRPKQRDVARNPRISWSYTAYKTIDYLNLDIEERDSGKLVLSVSDPDGVLGLQGEFQLFSPPRGVTLELADPSLEGQLKPGTWYVLSASADGDRGTHLAKVSFRTADR